MAKKQIAETDSSIKVNITQNTKNKIAALEEKLARLKKEEAYIKKIADERKAILDNPNSLYAVYKPDNPEDTSFWGSINKPHCPLCNIKLTRFSNIVHDEVWDTVNFCPKCGQALKWEHYNDDV